MARPTTDGSPPKRRSQSPWESTTNWLTWNALAERVGRDYPGRARRLRYEDLIARPRATVAELLSFTGLTDEQILNARIILWKGHCSVHQMFQASHVKQFRERDVEKVYWAIVEGRVAPPAGER